MPILIIILFCAIVTAVFALFPNLDLVLAGLFYDNTTQIFPLKGQPFWEDFRDFAMGMPKMLIAIFILVLAVRIFLKKAPAAPKMRSVIFLLTTLLLGPVLVVNIVLKEVSQRPRPVHVVQFGGSEQFKPFYDFSGSCRSNCSFVSGEVSAAAWTVGAAMLAPAPMNVPLVALAALYTAATGLARMAFGGHFASDVLLSAGFTWLIVLLSHKWFFRRDENGSEDSLEKWLQAARNRIMLLRQRREKL